MKTILLYISCFILLATPFVNAQNSATGWLQKSVETVNNATTLKVDVTTKVMAGSPTGTLIETTKGSLKRSGKNTLSTLGRVISIQNGSKALMVDKANTGIIISEKKQMEQPYDFAAIYTKLKPYIDTIYVLNQVDGYTDVICKYKAVVGLPYYRIDVRINNASNLPSVINMYMAVTVPMYEDELMGAKPVIQITYDNWKLDEAIGLSEFAFDSYVFKKDGKWQAVPAYKNFEITILN